MEKSSPGVDRVYCRNRHGKKQARAVPVHPRDPNVLERLLLFRLNRRADRRRTRRPDRRRGQGLPDRQPRDWLRRGAPLQRFTPMARRKQTVSGRVGETSKQGTGRDPQSVTEPARTTLDAELPLPTRSDPVTPGDQVRGESVVHPPGTLPRRPRRFVRYPAIQVLVLVLSSISIRVLALAPGASSGDAPGAVSAARGSPARASGDTDPP